MVSLTEEDGMAIVSVKDSGCGIDDENQKKLFHTDTHFSTFGTNNEEGSGLGLRLHFLLDVNLYNSVLFKHLK